MQRSHLVKIDKIKAKIKAIPACLNFINYADIVFLKIMFLLDLNISGIRANNFDNFEK